MKIWKAAILGGIAAFAAVWLTGCEKSRVPKSGESHAIDKAWNGDVARIAEAPDGTVLWGVRAAGHMVYFASAGTSYSESCGKNCTRTVSVPTAYRARDVE